MRCFLPCFSPSKPQKHLSKPLTNDILAISSSQQNPLLQESIHWISQSNQIATPHSSDSLFSVSIATGKPQDNAAAHNEGNISTPSIQPKHVSGSTPFLPLNGSRLEYRYRDCHDDDDDDDFYNEKTEEGSSESSLFSLSTDFSNRKRVSFSSTEKVDNEVSSRMVAPLQGEDGDDDDICSVKEVKATVLNSVKKDKENINWIEQETSLKVSSSKRKIKETEKEKEEIKLDTSLSDWLVESEDNYDKPKRGNVENRTILGALTVEEIRKCSSVSETCSKSNKCGKDGKQDWSSTTKKTRLENQLLKPVLKTEI